MCEPLCETDWKLVLAFVSIIATFIISVISLNITSKNSQKNRLVDVITSNRVQWIQKFKELMAAYLSKVSYHFEREFPEKTAVFMDNLLEISAQIKLHLNYRGKSDNKIIKNIDEINIAYEKFFIYVKFLKDIEESAKLSDLYTLIDIFQSQYPELFEGKYREILKNFKIDVGNKKKAFDQIDKLIEKDNFFEDITKQYLKLIDDDVKHSTRIIKETHKKLLFTSQVYLKTEWERVKSETGSGNLELYNFDEQFNKYKEEYG